MRNEEFTMRVTGGDAAEVQRLWQWFDERPMLPGGSKQLTGGSGKGQIKVNMYRVGVHSEMFVSGEVADYGVGVIVVGNEPLLNRLLSWLTREFPTLDGHLRVNVGDATGSSFDEYLFRQGQYTEFPKRYRGYYHTGFGAGFGDDEPTLAYEYTFLADGSQDDLIRRMRADGRFIDTTDPSDTLTRDDDATDYTNPWGCDSWSPDEELYLDAVQTIASGHRTDKPGLINHVRELYDAVCRDIEITPDEIRRLYDKCPADKEADYQSRASGTVFSGLEIGHIERAYLTGERLYPTARMLRHLAALTTHDARNSQLQDAIRNPRWAAPEYDWPIWRLERQYRQQWEKGVPAFDEAGFTADVRPSKND